MNPEDLARQKWRSVEKAALKRNRLVQELSETNERLLRLREELPQTEQADREAYAQALSAGKPGSARASSSPPQSRTRSVVRRP
jgi:hypothetical protein